MKFTTITIKDWKEVYDLEPEAGASIYRGQQDCNWPLETSLFRRASSTLEERENVINSEHWMLREFRRRAHHYTSDLPSKDDFIGWLTIMQQHGGVSRLLDFTRSFYVACYFAISGSQTDACVWCIDDGWLSSCGCAFAQKLGYKAPRLRLRDDELDFISDAANRFLVETYKNFKAAPGRSPCDPAVLMIEPLVQIRRLSAQQGVFLMPTDAATSFEENLAAMRKHYPYRGKDAKLIKDPATHVRKIILPRSIHDHAMMHLRSMNISAETLFPDIGGFARAIVESYIPLTA